MKSGDNGVQQRGFVQSIGASNRGRKASSRQKLNSAISILVEKLESRTLLSASLSAGTLDPNFGVTGKVITDFVAQDQGTCVAIDSHQSNDLVVAGVSNGNFTVAVYSSTGSLITQATPTINGGTGYSQANAVTIDSTGGILVAGYVDDHATNDDFVLARYTFDGTNLTLDNTFGTGGQGYVVTDLNGGKSDIADAAAIDGNDILLAGESGTGASEHAAVVAYTSSGVLDTTFGSAATGIVVTTGAADQANAITVDPSANVVLAGQTGAGQAEIIVLPSTGTSFQKYALNLGGSSAANAVVAQSNGEYLVAGTASGQFVLAEVMPNGTLDSGFGTAGEVKTSFSNSSFAQANAMAVQSYNGKIVLAGLETDNSGNDFFALARYDANGTVDTSFGTGGTVTTDFSGSASADSIAGGVAIQPDGLIVAAGFTGAGTNPDNFAVARYVSNNAPTATNATAALDSITENNESSPGNTVATLVTRFGMTDPDGDTVGLAITGVEDTYGTWQYSINGGTNWTNISTGVSDGNALLLAPAALVRFLPDNNDTGSSTITVRAWDQTTGTNGAFANVTTNAAANYNSFSDNAYTASIAVTILVPPAVVFVDNSWTGAGYGTNVTDGFGQHTFGVNAFATIQEGVNAVAPNGTVEVDAGTYAENVDVIQSLTILGPNANIDPNTGTRVAEAIVVPAVADIETGDGGAGDTNGTIFRLGDPTHPTNPITVTINGLTIDGNSPLLPTSEGRSLNGVYVDTGAGIDNSVGSYDQNPGGMATTMIVQYNIIENLDRYGVLGDAVNGSTALTGANVSYNKITNIPSGNNYTGDRGRGVAFEDNYYGSVTHNVITDVNVGYQNDNFYLADPSGQGLVIEDNTISTYHRGIFYNLMYDNASTGTIENNVLSVDNSGLGADANNFGLEIISVESGVGVTALNNSDTGSTYGILLTGDNTTAGLTVSGGTLTDNVYGVYVTDNDPQFPSDGNTPNAVINGVTISGATGAGVYVQEANGETVGATITGGTSISGGNVGILVSGPDASLAFWGTSAASLSTLSGNYITLENGAMGSPTPSVIDASNVTFDGLGGSNVLTTLAQYYGIENRITDYLDDSTLGYVHLNAGNVYVAQSSETPNAGAIQRGINVAATNDTVNVQAGVYVGELDIETPLTLAGAQAGIDPNPSAPAAADQTIIEPDTSDPNPYDNNAVLAVYVGVSGVTINGVTVDGSNPNLTHLDAQTTDDASEGIVSYTGVGNITVKNNIIENTAYTGVDFYNYTSDAPTANNVITDNLIQNLSDTYGFGIGVNLYNNFYAQVTHNVMNDVTVGVQTGNFSQANSDNTFTPEISNNTIAASGVGIFYNLMYDGSSTITVSNNHITAINSSADAPWQGVLLTSIQDPASVSFQNNTIDGSNAYTNGGTVPSSGYEVWNTPTTGSVLISGGSVTGVDYGVWLNTYEGYSSDAVSTQVTISGVNISASKIGVYVEDSPQNGTATASATIEGNTSITTNTTSGIGVEVSGSTASATITGNDASIDGNLVGIEVVGGSATITSNHIYDNGTGIEFIGGGSGSVTGNNFDGGSTPLDNGTDLDIESGAGAVTDGGGNAFAGTQYINNLELGNVLNATADYFSGALASSLLPSQAYPVEDRITDYLDNPTYGYVKLNAANVYVTQVSENTTPGAIQRGVNVAPTNSGTVNVHAGSFSGSVNIIGKNLTLDGAGNGAGGTTIVAPASITSQFSTGSGSKYAVIYANANDVVIENLAVNGASSGNGYGDGFLGIAYYNAGGTVNNVTIENVENSPFNGVQNGVALYAYNADNAVRSLSVTSDVINNYQKNGMALFGNGLTVDVANNTVTGAGPTAAIAQNGIEVGDGAAGTISDNTVSGNEYNGSGGGPDQFSDVQSTGLLLYGTSGLQVTGNIIDGNDIGIYNNTDGATISGNQLGNTTANRYEGIVEDQGSSAISANTIQGGNIGIDIVSFVGNTGASQATLDGNIVSGAGVGIEAIRQDNTTPAVDVLAQNNTLSGNTEGVLISGGATVDLGTDASDLAHQNFTPLGTSAGHNILTGYTGGTGHYAIDDQNTPQGTEPDVLAEDNNFGPYSPSNPSAIAQVINDHHDNSSLTTVYYLPALNQQTAPETVYVNASWAGSVFGSDADGPGPGTSFGYDEFSDIQSGINAVASGGIVDVAAGTYADPTITKSLTLNGAQAGNDAATRVATPGYAAHESVITTSSADTDTAASDLLNIEASNVTINGFDLDGIAGGYGAHNGIATVDSSNNGQAVNNIIVEDNIVQNVGHDGIAMIDPSDGSAVTSGDQITGNVVQNFVDYGVVLAYNAYGDVTSNTVIMPDNAEAGVWVYDFTANGGSTATNTINVSQNNVTAGQDDFGGIWANLDYAPTATLNVTDNTVNAGTLVTGADGYTNGIYLSTIQNGFSVNLTGNTVGSSGGQFATGISLWNLPTSNTVTVSGGSVGNSVVGVEVDNDDVNFGSGDSTSVNISGVSITGATTGILASGDSLGGGTISADISDNNISSSTTGIEVSGPNASATISGNIIDDSTTAGIYVSGGSASISGNTITGGGDGIDADNLSGGNPALTITGNTISGGSGHGMNLQDLSDGSTIGGAIPADGNNVTIGGGGTGIQTGFAQGSLTIENNDISASGAGALGIDAVGTSGALTIDDNTVSGAAVSIDVNISEGAVTVSGNTVTNSADGDGIVVFNTATAADVSGNILNSSSSAPNLDDAAGIEISSAGSGVSQADLTGNTITGFYTGVQVDSSFGGSADATATFNTLTDDATGIKVNGGTLVADNNLISGGSGDAVDVTAIGSPSVTLYDNALNNSGLGVNNANSAVVDASGNWWGANTESGVQSQIGGAAYVDYTPWLDTSANSASGTGFDGDFSKLDVGSGGAQVQSGGRINEAIGDLITGGTIKVYAGTYNESVDITKPLTLESVGSVVITDPASFAVVTIDNGVSGAVLNGFTIVASASNWALDVAGTNATIENNTFESANVGNVIVSDHSDAFTGNTFDSPSAASEPNFLQFQDSATSGYSSNGEVPTLLADNTFDRAVTVQNAGGYLGNVWSNIQAAVNAALGGDTVAASAGTYAEEILIDKSITLDGAQAGVDARSRSGSESIVSNSEGDFQIEADNVTIDGFTLEGVTADPGSDLNSLGVAIWTNPGYSGTHGGTQILNNIIQGNIAGIELDNDGTYQTVVQYNLIQNNNALGAGSGNGVETSFGLSNALIDSNTFSNNSNAAVVVEAPSQGIVISNNQADSAFALFDTTNSQLTANTIANSTSGGVYLGGGDDNVEISQNDISNNPGAAGVEVDNAYGVGTNSDINVHNNFLDNNRYGVLVTAGALSGSMSVNINHIALNTTAGLENDSTVTVDASNNWWNSANGPDTTLNTFQYPTSGDKVIGTDVIIAPWLSDGIDSEPAVAGFQHANANATPTTPTIALEASSDTYGAPNGPDLGIGTDSDGITNDSTPTFDGAGDNGDTVNLYEGANLLGTAMVTGGGWSISSTHLADGTYAVYAIATDPHGNNSASSGTVSVTIDTAAPAAPSTPILTASDSDSPASSPDSGIGTNSDDITNVNTPTFTGTGEAGTLIRLYANNVEVGYTTATGTPGHPGGAGTWSITTSALADASYTIDATATDTAGNTSVLSGTLAVTIDTTAPGAPIAPAMTAGSDTGFSNSDGITSDNTPVFTGTAEAGTLIRLYANGVEVGFATATGTPGHPGGAGTWSIATSVLADGSYTIDATATDTAGNTSALSGTTTAVIDTHAPAPTIDGSSANAESGPEGTLISLAGLANDPAPSSGIYSYDWHVVASNSQTITDGTSQSFSFTPEDKGTYTVTYTVTDNAGNVGTASDIITVGDVAPVAAISAAPGTNPAGTPISLTGTASDVGSVDNAAGYTFAWSVSENGNPGFSASGSTSAGASSVAINFTPVLYGTYVVTLTATDHNGVSSAPASENIIVSEVTPAITLSGSKSDPTNSIPNAVNGDTFTLTLGPLQDSDLIPGGDTINSYTILWGDGSTVITGAQLANLVANGGTVTHVYESGTSAESSTPNTDIQVDVTLTD
ncbi:MAG: right-handed parallel beta-helix repeat-containing protein [Tepidisphaeraceae bacterium]